MKRLRTTLLLALPFVVVAGWLAWKIHDQTHRPIGVLIVDQSR